MNKLRQAAFAIRRIIANIVFLFNVARHALDINDRLRMAEAKIAKADEANRAQWHIVTGQTEEMGRLKLRLNNSTNQIIAFRKALMDIQAKAMSGIETRDPAGRYKIEMLNGINETARIALIPPKEILAGHMPALFTPPAPEAGERKAGNLRIRPVAAADLEKAAADVDTGEPSETLFAEVPAASVTDNQPAA